MLLYLFFLLIFIVGGMQALSWYDKYQKSQPMRAISLGMFFLSGMLFLGIRFFFLGGFSSFSQTSGAMASQSGTQTFYSVMDWLSFAVLLLSFLSFFFSEDENSGDSSAESNSKG